jgi:hypothetical protein
MLVPTWFSEAARVKTPVILNHGSEPLNCWAMIGKSTSCVVLAAPSHDGRTTIACAPHPPETIHAQTAVIWENLLLA